MEGELLDWELIHGSDTESASASVIDDGMILSDHFFVRGSEPVGVVSSSGLCGSVDAGVRGGLGLENSVNSAQGEAVAESNLQVTDARRVEEPVEDSGGNQLVSGHSGIVKGEDESQNRESVWWKMPFALLKYRAFRIGSVWSLSVAVAVMGFLLLGRRLYSIKRKAQSFHLRVTIDDKKALQVMSQAARLGGVFREVKRVPVIPPALPCPAASPLLTLR